MYLIVEILQHFPVQFLNGLFDLLGLLCLFGLIGLLFGVVLGLDTLSGLSGLHSSLECLSLRLGNRLGHRIGRNSRRQWLFGGVNDQLEFQFGRASVDGGTIILLNSQGSRVVVFEDNSGNALELTTFVVTQSNVADTSDLRLEKILG